MKRPALAEPGSTKDARLANGKNKYGVKIPLDELWAMRLAEKLRASKLDLSWVRTVEPPLGPADILRRHPSIHLLLAETNRELGNLGTEEDVYWAALNAAFDAPIDIYHELANGKLKLVKCVRLKAVP